MASDELILEIDKVFWPKGVMRGLTPLLREVGDKHGNLVVAAVPNKHIMVKGAGDKIEEAKPELRRLIEEHFPDAPIPEELGGGGAGAAAEEEETGWEEEEAPAPAASVVPTPPPQAQLASPAEPLPPVTMRKRAGAGAAPPLASPEVLWLCMRKNSSFVRSASRGAKRPWSAEPTNMTGLHAFKYCGLSSREALNVRPVKRGAKESIELVQSKAKTSQLRRPRAAFMTTGLSKCPKQGLHRLKMELQAKFYRRDLHALAVQKYLKLQRSFKTKKQSLKSRRAGK